MDGLYWDEECGDDGAEIGGSWWWWWAGRMVAALVDTSIVVGGESGAR